MPKFMLLIRATLSAESPPNTIPNSTFTTMAAFNESLASAGVLLAAEGFHPTSIDSYRVTFKSDGAAPDVTSGPFDVTKEDHICGFWLLACKDVEEALEWAKKIPFPEGEVVVRRVADCNELGEGFTEELRVREGELRGKLEENRKAAGM